MDLLREPRLFRPLSPPSRTLALRTLVLCAGLGIIAASCRDSAGPGESQVPASLDVVGGNAQQATVGTQLSNPLVARVLDQHGNPIAGQLVNFRVTFGGGSVFAGSAITNQDGIARERWTLGTSTADSQVVEARAVDAQTGEAVIFGTFRATAVAAAPDTVWIVSGNNQNAPAASAFPDSFLVRVVDHYGNPVSGVTVTWSSPAAAGTLANATSITSATGHASTRLTAGTVRGTYTISAAVNALSVPFTVDVVAAAPASLRVYAGDAQTGTAGRTLPIPATAQVLDAYGNPTSGVAVTITVTGSVYTDVTDSLGLSKLDWTLRTVAGVNTLQFSVAGLPPLTFTATGVAGPANRMMKTAGDNQTAPSGTTVPVRPVVILYDIYDNVVTGAEVQFSVGVGGGTVTGAQVITDETGAATVGSWTLGAARGEYLLTASKRNSLDDFLRDSRGEVSKHRRHNHIAPAGSGSVLAGDTLQVAAQVTSVYSLASVRASINSAQIDLAYSSDVNRWVGKFPLQSFARGTLELVVTARDINGSATEAFAQFEHDTRPTLTVSPIDSGAVLKSSITFAADCIDDDPAGCSTLTLIAAYPNTLVGAQTLATGQSHIEGTASLAAFNGSLVRLIFTGIDSRNQSVQVIKWVYVEASTNLTEISSVSGVVWDIRGDQLLYRALDGSVATKTISSGVTQTLYSPASGASAPSYGFLTGLGAIFAQQISTFPYTKVLESRSGGLLELGGLNSSSSLNVAGDFAIFSNGTLLTRRDLAAGTNVEFSNVGNTDNGIAPNGDVAFWGSDYKVRRYRDGTTTILTPGDTLWNVLPVTDGLNVVYRKQTPCCNARTYSIVLHDGVSETILTTPRTQAPAPGSGYAVNGGWTAFTNLDANGVLQVWTRSPAGAMRQVSFFGTTSNITAIAPDGTVIFANGNRRYRVLPTGTAQDLMSTNGPVVWRDGRFVVFIGETAFAINQ